MLLIETGLLILLAAVCVYATYTDITRGLIYNRVLLPLFVLGTAMDIAYYGWLYPVGRSYFALNVIAAVAFSVILYALHIWAAGDSKLLILITLLIPVRTTLIGERYYPEIVIIAIAFAVSFVYLVYDSMRMWRKRGLDTDKVAQSFRRYIMRLMMSCIYIMTLYKMEGAVLPRLGITNTWVSLILNLCLVLILSGIGVVWTAKVCIPVLVLSIAYSAMTGVWLMNRTRAVYYVATAVVMLLQLIVNEFNYDSIPTDEVRKGMVLSSGSIMILSISKVKGLPTETTEDLRSRITDAEAAAIRKWGRTKESSGMIQIVRKMPFAIFITIGVAAYYLLIFLL